MNLYTHDMFDLPVCSLALALQSLEKPRPPTPIFACTEVHLRAAAFQQAFACEGQRARVTRHRPNSMALTPLAPTGSQSPQLL